MNLMRFKLYIKLSFYENTTYCNSGDAAEGVLRENVIALSEYIRKEKLLKSTT